VLVKTRLADIRTGMGLCNHVEVIAAKIYRSEDMFTANIVKKVNGCGLKFF